MVVVCRTDYDTYEEIYEQHITEDGNVALKKANATVDCVEKILSHELNQTTRSYVLIQSKLNDN
jgi:hypothetical protein